MKVRELKKLLYKVITRDIYFMIPGYYFIHFLRLFINSMHFSLEISEKS